MGTAVATRFTTGHVGLNVSDLARARAFYQAVFGFEVRGESADGEHEYVFLGQGDTLVLTLWRQSDGRFQPARPGLHHLSFKADSIEDVRAAETRLRALGATIHHGGIVRHREGVASGGLFFEDPDGIRLEIFAPTGLEASGAPHGAAPTCGFF